MFRRRPSTRRNRPLATPSPVAAASACAVEGLESRLLFHVVVTTPVTDVTVNVNAPAGTVNLNDSFNNDELTGTIVRMVTNQGNIDLELFDQQKPITVTNFLNYVNSGRYNNTIFHRRTDPGTEGIGVIQGGGYTAPDANSRIQNDAPIQLEVQQNGVIPNSRGTIAMARTSDPNSATSEFFINNTDNSSTLGPSNGGGYAVFGHVIGSTLGTVDAIAALARFNAGGAFSTMPVLNVANGSAADNLVRVTGASVIPELSFEVIGNTNAAVVTPTISGGQLMLAYPAGATGSSDVTIRATDVLGNTATDTFTVNVLSGSELSIAVGDSGTKSLTFTDADGTDVTVTYKGGTANVLLAGSGLAQQQSGKGTVVTGTGVDLTSIAITGATGGGALTVKGKGGDGLVRLGSVTSDGSLKSVSAKEVVLTNGMSINGSAGKVDLLRATGGTISMSGNGAVSLTADTLTDTDVNLAGELKSLKLNAYNRSAGSTHGMDVGALGKVTVSGDYQGNLTSRGGLGGASVKGGIGGGAWNIAAGGKAGKVSAGSIAEDWAGNFSGALSGISTSGDMGGQLSAPAVKSISVKGNLRNALLVVSDPGAGAAATLGKLSVGGTIANTTIRSLNSLGTITANSLNASKVYAGVTPAPSEFEPSVPVDNTFFANPEAGIKSVSLKGKNLTETVGTFTASNVAAPSLGKIALNTIDTTTVGILYGVAADRISSLTGDAGNGKVINFKNLDDPTDAASQIAALGGLGNFVIRVF